MTEKEIVDIIGKKKVLSGQIICPNVNYLFPGQQDAIGVMRSGFIIEYEIKISRADFARDRLKGKFFRYVSPDLFKDRVPNYFCYVVPKELIEPEEVPEFAGLYYVEENDLKLIKKAPLIHSKKIDPLTVLKKISRIYSERQFLGGCLMTYKNKL